MAISPSLQAILEFVVVKLVALLDLASVKTKELSVLTHVCMIKNYVQMMSSTKNSDDE